MTKLPRCLLLVWLLALVSGVARGAELRKDIEYGRAGEERLRLDAHVPDGSGPFPVVILVHGGGWSGGDKSGSTRPGDGADITPLFGLFSSMPCTWFSINYRLAPAHRWPACLDDLNTAIRWVKAHAAEFKGDPMRIALAGHSAGGHLVMFAATQDDPATRVQAVVGFAPVTDLVADSERRGGVSPSLQNLLGVPKELTDGLRQILRNVSPIEHVNAAMPPVLIVHGDADKTVPLQQSSNFIARLKAVGVPCELITRHNVPHSLVQGEQIDASYRDPTLVWLRDWCSRARPARPSAR